MAERGILDSHDMRARMRPHINSSRYNRGDYSHSMYYSRAKYDTHQPIRHSETPELVSEFLPTHKTPTVGGSSEKSTTPSQSTHGGNIGVSQPAMADVHFRRATNSTVAPIYSHAQSISRGQGSTPPLSVPRKAAESSTTVNRTEDLKSNQSNKPLRKARLKLSRLRPTRTSILTGMAVVVFLLGLGVSLAGFRTNSVAQAQEDKINSKARPATTTAASTVSNDTTPPSTIPIPKKVQASYQVAGDLARYIRIPKLGVFARVLQVGVTSSGALATPTNVFDTAWYTGSAKPGQPGATLIDGHVSSWTSHGVFYGIKNLKPGDTIEIERGDGTKLVYAVDHTTLYNANGVDMSALMTPAVSGKSGLNLITCGGKYDSNSGEFTQRVAVFATLQ